MGRKRRTAAFSLFSFQDIITAVTAILILILLIMTLSLIEQKRSASAVDGSVSRSAMEGLVQEVTRRRNELRDTIETARKTNHDQRSRKVVESEIAERQSDLDSIRSKRDETDRTLKAAQRLMQKLEKQLDARRPDFEKLANTLQEIEGMQAQVNELEESNEEERRRQLEQQQEIDDRPVGEVLVFNPGDDSDLQPWLLNASAEGIAAIELGHARRIPLGANAGTLAFTKWLSERAAASDHCLILVRPSGVRLLDDIEEKLREKGLAFGIDLVAEDVAVRDGKAEAASE